VDPGPGASQFDYGRHGKTMNVGYLDGHVGGKPLRQSSLESIIIWHHR